MDNYKDVFDMSGCKNICDFVQKNVKCSEKEAFIFISKFHFFERVESGADTLSFVLKHLKNEDYKWRKIDIDKVDLDFLTYLDDLRIESVLDNDGWDAEDIYDSVIQALEKATATELGLI